MTVDSNKDIKKTSFVLKPIQVEFFRCYIQSYLKHFEKGDLAEAHHDATALLLHLAGLLGELDDN
jgi:hypothetical protein